MKMFTRDMILNGPPVAVREWAVGVAAAFEDATGESVAVWTSIAGGTNGHYTWSMSIEGAASITANTMTAFADQTYLAKIEEGRGFFVGQPQDTIYRAYNAVGDDESAPGSVAVVTSATARAGSLGEAIGWGLESAQYVSGLTGIPTALLGNAAGRFSDLTWIGVAADAAAADAAMDTWSDDDGYRKLLARGGDHFVDGSARTQLFLRVG